MWNTPTRDRLSKIPGLYKTEHIHPKDKLIYLHFFIGGSDWYICEYDGEDMFFGYAILNNDYQNAEWGYISFSELQDLSFHGIEVDCENELWFPIQPVNKIDKIRKGMDLQ